MSDKTRVLISGYRGRMGSTTVRAVFNEPDLEVVGGFDATIQATDVELAGKAIAPAFQDLTKAITQTHPDVIVDFTLPSVVANNLKVAMSMGIDSIVGTTGMSDDTLQDLIALAPAGTSLFVAPNFTTGAILMIAAAKLAAKYFPDVEITEFHHNNKADAPSGTAINTAKTIDCIRNQSGIKSTAPGSETEIEGLQGARGARIGDVRLHSVRSNGFVASQEIIFGSPGQTLTIRHDSIDRTSYMPGVLLAIRCIREKSGLVIGLEELMDL